MLNQSSHYYLENMVNHTLTCYDKDLLKIRHSIVKMGLLVAEIIKLAVEAFSNHKSELADQAKATDIKVNKLDHEVEELAIEVIALKSPKAGDLRETIAALKIAVILERMGDLAKGAARKVVIPGVLIKTAILNEIKEMSEIVILMQTQVIKAYEADNLAMLDVIFENEQKVDDHYLKLRIAIENEILKNPDQTSQFITILFALKNLERIADYITKIAYISKYVVTGEVKNYDY